MKVSVVVAVFNGEPFLAECIASVRAQSFGDWELVVVDDGSTDESANIAMSASRGDPRVRLLRRPHEGASAARNAGICLASGEYVFVMDADDTIDSEFLSSMISAADRENADIVVGAFAISRMPYPPALPTCGGMFRRAIIQTYPDVCFPLGIQPGEDGIFTHQLLALAKIVASAPQAIYHYRMHNGQNHIKCRQDLSSVLGQIPKWLTILASFYDRHNLWKTHSVHLARFIEHEPFELRMLDMPFDDCGEEKIYNEIKRFWATHLVKYVGADSLALTSDFRKLLATRDFAEYRCVLRRTILKRQLRTVCLKYLVCMKRFVRRILWLK